MRNSVLYEKFVLVCIGVTQANPPIHSPPPPPPHTHIQVAALACMATPASPLKGPSSAHMHPCHSHKGAPHNTRHPLLQQAAASQYSRGGPLHTTHSVVVVVLLLVVVREQHYQQQQHHHDPIPPHQPPPPLLPYPHQLRVVWKQQW